jgi:uncharacterized FAD-dependent dehydrogenase
MKNYDVIIVGAGPAGIFAALELVSADKDIKILLLEKGRELEKRICPSEKHGVICRECPECNLLCGWGGAGAFSDGKLTLSKETGGNLSRYIDTSFLGELLAYVDDIYVAYGAPPELYGGDTEKVNKLKQVAEANRLTLVPSRIRHIGTDRCPEVLRNMKQALNSNADILFSCDVTSFLVDDDRVTGVMTEKKGSFSSEYVIIAPGREGAVWLEDQARRTGLSLLKNPVDIGVRVELSADVLKPLTDIAYEPKLIFESQTFGDRARTFCVNPYGEVVKEYLQGVWTVNGHSYSGKKTGNTNFAILVSTSFTEPFDEPHLYGRNIAHLANLLGNGIILQRLGDLRAGHRSTPQRIAEGRVEPTLADAVPGDLSFVLPYRYVTDILEMLEAMDRIAPGVNGDDTLLYGVEVKFYSRQLKLDSNLETEINNLFAIGDGAGVSRGLIQASASGVIAAREILKRIGTKA